MFLTSLLGFPAQEEHQISLHFIHSRTASESFPKRLVSVDAAAIYIDHQPEAFGKQAIIPFPWRNASVILPLVLHTQSEMIWLDVLELVLLPGIVLFFFTPDSQR